MNWQAIHKRLVELEHDHRLAPIHLEFTVQDPGDIKKRLIRASRGIYEQHIWPRPNDDEQVDNENHDASNEPTAPKPLAGFQHIVAVAENREVLRDFLDLANNAGVKLPSQELERAEIPKSAPPATRWVLWLRYMLRDHHRRFVQVDKDTHIWADEYEVHTLRDALTASLVAIDEAELAIIGDDSNHQQTAHSEDFTSVIWFGTTYQFNKTQATCVKLLWHEWKKGRLGLSEKTIGEVESSSDRYRLRHSFRMKGGSMHAAWETMIRPTGKGIFALRAPNHQ